MKFLLSSLLILSVTLNAYVYQEQDRTFASILHVQDYAQTVAIGNTVLCLKDNTGTCIESPAGSRNDQVNLEYISNSSADLASPFTNQSIEWAGLFWQGRGYTQATAAAALADLSNADHVNIDFPDGTSHTITLKGTDYLDGDLRDDYNDYFYTYAAYTEITSTLQTYIDNGGNPLGTYNVTYLHTESGNSPDGLGYFGAWTLVVIFKDTDRLAPLKDINIFNGYVAINDVNPTADINIDGFITTQDVTKPVEAAITAFTGEGDKYITGDRLLFKAGPSVPGTTPDSDFTEVTYNGGSTSNPFASNISGSFARSPNLTNNNAIDLHTIEVGKNGSGYEIIGHDEYQAAIRLKTGGDHYYASMLAFEANILEPNFCYSYSYSQNNRDFTEDNPGGTNPPRLVGTILPGADINMTIYVRNQDDSDVSAINMEVNVTNIDTAQAKYKRNTTRVTNPQNVSSVAISDASLSVADSYIKGIPIDDVAGQQFFYTFYTLDTSALSGNDINMSIEVNIGYDLILPTPDGGSVVIPSSSLLGGLKVPMCSTNGIRYMPEYGPYNVEHESNYISQKYNLPTQVAKRPDNFKIVSYDPESLDERNITNTTVFVELIDAGRDSDSGSACNNEERSISERIFVGFKGTESVDFNKQYILDHSLDATRSVEEFFGEAHENVLFKISYNVLNDENESLVDSEFLTGTGWVIHNFNELAQGVVNANLDLPPQDQNKCRDDVTYSYYLPNGNLKTETYTTMPQACGNNAAFNGMTDIEMAICMQCVFGYNTKAVCSRDNFSTRPEAFNINIYDNNESTNKADPVLLIPKVANISAGYKYRYDINATSHEGNDAAIGYSQDYRIPRPDQNLSFVWSPLPLKDVTGCNDTFPKHPPVFIQDGVGINDPNLANINDTVQNSSPNVGRYQLNMIDTTWTGADQNPYHHSLLEFSDHFLPGDDCLINSNIVPDNSVQLTAGNPANLDSANIGCSISSNHVNSDAGIIYQDHNISIRPYAFDISQVQFQKGIFDLNLSIPGPDLNSSNAFVYQNNLVRIDDDINMSARFTGELRAVGADFNQSLSNFVANCYAEDLNLDLNTSSIPTVNAPAFQYRLRQLDSSSQIIINDNISGSNDDVFPRANNLVGLVVLPENDFNKSMNGVSNIEFNVNFAREANVAYNPIILTYNDFNVSCTTLADCQSRADMELLHDVNGTYSVFNPEYAAAPLNIVHLYGREHVPRHRVEGPNATVPIYYEFFCDLDAASQPAPCNIATYINVPDINHSISPDRLLSPDDVRWYTQMEHNTSVDGNASFTQTRDVNFDRVGDDNQRFNNMVIDINATNANYQYNGSRGYPYKATIEVSTPDWLIYNRYDGSATINRNGNVVNNFELEFTQTGGWAGKDNSGMEADSDASSTTNRRIQW